MSARPSVETNPCHHCRQFLSSRKSDTRFPRNALGPGVLHGNALFERGIVWKSKPKVFLYGNWKCGRCAPRIDAGRCFIARTNRVFQGKRIFSHRSHHAAGRSDNDARGITTAFSAERAGRERGDQFDLAGDDKEDKESRNCRRYSIRHVTRPNLAALWRKRMRAPSPSNFR